MPPRRSKSSWQKSYEEGLTRRYSAGGSYQFVGLDLVVSVVFGLFGGRWLDGKLGTSPWLSMIGFGLGVIAGFRFLYRAAIKMRKETEDEDERERRSQGGSDGSPPPS